ncbi:MAG TPA: hypothetical protein VFV19_06490 [Candidatus Polarisedimenticolaceae bacterium]|nr:hypothetical protein [Candidatus Polarisedimenticolaceae bacterium]
MVRTLLALATGVLMPTLVLAAPPKPSIAPATVDATVAKIVAAHPGSDARARQGVAQAAQRWFADDGDDAAFTAFCALNFAADDAARDAIFARLETVLEQIDGRIHEIRRMLVSPQDLDTGPVSPLDLKLGDLDLAAHVDDDLFKTKVAFVALLNFPVHTLAERLTSGGSWSRDTWARSRMMDRFAVRVPAEIQQEATKAFTAAEQYIAGYNIRLDKLVDRSGKPLGFPDGLSVITHWGLRDELKSHYAEGAAGLAKQRAIYEVMTRIVRQEIPKDVIDRGDRTWNPWSPAADADREPDTRYRKLLDTFQAVRLADPYCPTAPTYIDRKFELDRQIPETQVEQLLVSVLSSAEVKDLAALIVKRLGRPLEPFDIWYAGFSPRAGKSEAELDAITKAKYPSVEAFQAGLPSILTGLGFTAEKASWLAERIVVDPSRGAGHAMGAVRREDKAHLRTRIPSGGMLYKGYNIAIHELGHNVEQSFSLGEIDHWFLNGVPNNAFTEALAFVFQGRDLELLGLAGSDEERAKQEALNDLWGAYEIGGVALVDMGVWRYMYAHPDVTPAQLRVETLRIARDVWNRYYAPLFGVKDVDLLAVYSHMISYGMYLPDYPLGHIIAFQVAKTVRVPKFGAEFERVARQGRLTPDAWMRGAVGAPLSAQPLLDAARAALRGQ